MSTVTRAAVRSTTSECRTCETPAVFRVTARTPRYMQSALGTKTRDWQCCDWHLSVTVREIMSVVPGGRAVVRDLS
jgi:hypothetical protein